MAKRSHFPSVHQSGLHVLPFTDFSGGYVSIRRGLNLEANELQDVLNLKFFRTEMGVGLITREGLKKQTTTAAIGHAVKDFGYYVDASGTVHILCVANSTLYVIVGGSAISKGALGSTRGRGVQFGDYWVIADGDYLKRFDGTSLEFCYDSGGTMFDTTDTLDYGSSASLYNGSIVRAGQKVTTPNWGASAFAIPIESVTFWISKSGSPTGNAVCKVRKVSDDSVVATSANRDVSAFETAGQEEVFTFSSGEWEPNTAYYVAVEYSGGDGSNYIKVHYSTTTTESGNFATYTASWSDVSGDAYWKISPGLPPKAEIIEEKDNRLWIVDADDKNRLRYCQLRDCNDWSTSGAAGSIYIEGGPEITALRTFYNLLTIHVGVGHKCVFKLTGSSPSDFSKDILFPGAAAVGPDLAWNTGNDLLFLDNAGLISLMAWERTGDFEYSIQSDQVSDLVLPNVASTRFACPCPTDQQYWLDVNNSSYFLVFDAQYRIWTKFKFELGASVTPTAFGLVNGEVYVGDSAGHVWKYDQKDQQYQDGSTDYTMYALLAPSTFDTLMQKHAQFVNVMARTRTGGGYNLVLYKNLDRDAMTTIAVTVPFDPDLTVDEATMDVDDAVWKIDDASTNLFLQPVNFEFKAVQVGIEDITLTRVMLIQGAEVHAAVLNRT